MSGRACPRSARIPGHDVTWEDMATWPAAQKLQEDERRSPRPPSVIESRQFLPQLSRSPRHAASLCHDLRMRLNPGTSLAHADDVLLRAATTWANARGVQDLFAAYIDAVHGTYPTLKQAFAAPDLAVGLHSTAYWNLLAIGSTKTAGWINATDVPSSQRALRAQNQALATEIENQMKAMEQARSDLEALELLTTRPGLPIVYDTNMLNHWQQPDQVRWREVLKGQGEKSPQTRLVVPLHVVDELDRQKYGQGDLAKKAAAAIRFLERTLKDSQPGHPVQLREGVTLEIWVDTDDRGGDTDLSILRCAADLDNLHPDTGARVLTDDIGMRLRAQQMDLKVMRLPEDHRKKGTALEGERPQAG